MVIRRIREHVATQNWFAVAIDFLIVVAGIVIAAQVNNWNQTRIERAQGQDYRERLVADLRANEADFLDRRAYYNKVRTHAGGALAALDRPLGQDGEAFLVDAYLASHILARRPKRFTYDELVSTGRFGAIGHAALREEIAEYYVRLDANQEAALSFVPPYREYVRERMPNAAQQAIRSQCGILLTDVTADCAISLDPAVAAKAVSAIRSPAMTTGLTRVIADLDVKLRLIELTVERERKLRATIERLK